MNSNFYKYIFYFVIAHAIISAITAIYKMSIMVDKSKEFENEEINKVKKHVLDLFEHANEITGAVGLYTAVFMTTVTLFFGHFIEFSYFKLLFTNKYKLK